MPHRLLSAAELADYLHVTPADVERLLRDSDIPHSKRGNRIVFQRGEIDAWASRRILGLPSRRLDAYHEKTIRGTQMVFPDAAIIPGLIAPANIELSITAKTRASVIREMVALADRSGLVFEPKELLASIEAREQLCSTALPGGIALLHARHHDAYLVERSFIVLGRTFQSIPFGAPDGQPTRLFFLVCCQDDRIHLHTLARLCVMATKTDVISHLLNAPDRDTAHQALISAEEAVLPASPHTKQ
jgi:PTS system nitrogen regulatory IIA component